jgi:hypothetical protein
MRSPCHEKAEKSNSALFRLPNRRGETIPAPGVTFSSTPRHENETGRSYVSGNR